MTSIKEENTQITLVDYVSELLKDIAVEEGFSNFSFLPTVGSKRGDGFTSVMLRVCISGQKNGKSDNLHLMVKMPPTDETLRKQFMSACVFDREILMYNKILPLFIKFQKEKGITDDHNGFLAFPKCYATLSDKMNDQYVIIMEDLRQTGYNMFDKFEVIDTEHIRLVLKELAKLHAISFAFRDQRPEEFEDLKKMTEVFLDQLVIGSDLTRKFIHYTFDEAIKSLEPTENEAIEIMANFRDNFVNEMRECVGLGVAEPLSVISHGDAWNNNFQFQYNESNTPKKVVLVDWQLSRYGSPVLDVVYFIFSSTNKQFRNELYDEIIRFYYDNLTAMIDRLGSDPNKLFGFDDFKAQLAKFGKFALLTAPMLSQVCNANPKDIPCFNDFSKELLAKDGEPPDFEKLDMFITTETKKAYELNVTHVIKDAIRLGYY